MLVEQYLLTLLMLLSILLTLLHLLRVLLCYLTYSAIANASGTVPTHFTYIT